MAKKSIRIRAKMKGNVTEVKALMSHAMETGLRKDKKTDKKIPAHFIQEVKCEHNGKQVLLAEWGVAVSKDPYLSFKFSGANKGDKISISWYDNMGKSASAESTIK
ncbi:MAG: thiosulfate oxidation carrier complex protein SoxZ [Gammaproteobacteria bacterium]|nr:thiosulfate oxidation carrier complex protein SoxZ [Gammaproteobacteria bacterium]